MSGSAEMCPSVSHSRLLPFLTKAKEQMPDGAIWPQQYKATEQS
jgi:hypothetical protein